MAKHDDDKQAQALKEKISKYLDDIIVKSDTKVLVEQAMALGTSLGTNKGPMELTKTQIRAIFGTVRQIEMSWGSESGHEQAKRSLILLKPKMLYRARKEKGSKRRGLEILSEILSESIDLVVSDEHDGNHQRFRNFVDFFEAILAYHTAAGGKSN